MSYIQKENVSLLRNSDEDISFVLSNEYFKSLIKIRDKLISLFEYIKINKAKLKITENIFINIKNKNGDVKKVYFNKFISYNLNKIIINLSKILKTNNFIIKKKEIEDNLYLNDIGFFCKILDNFSNLISEIDEEFSNYILAYNHMILSFLADFNTYSFSYLKKI